MSRFAPFRLMRPQPNPPAFLGASASGAGIACQTAESGRCDCQRGWLHRSLASGPARLGGTLPIIAKLPYTARSSSCLPGVIAMKSRWLLLRRTLAVLGIALARSCRGGRRTDRSRLGPGKWKRWETTLRRSRMALHSQRTQKQRRLGQANADAGWLFEEWPLARKTSTVASRMS